MNCISQEDMVDADEFSLLVEEAAGNRPISVHYAKELLENSGCFVFDGQKWEYNQSLNLGNGSVAWEQFQELFQGEKSVR